MTSTSTAIRTVEGVTAPEADVYEIDPSHSVIEFVVRHMGLAKVRGRFNEFSGTVRIGDNLQDSSAQATIRADSIDTRDENRDQHLRSADFLDVEQYPTLEFRTTGLRQEGDEWLVDGELTVVGETRPVSLSVDFEGGASDPWGNERIGFSASTTINREDYGLTWNQALETGGWLVGKEVKLEASVEAVKQS